MDTPRMNMHRKEFIAELARRTDLTHLEAESAVRCFLDILQDTWAQSRSVCFKGFGAFYIRPASSRIARNLQTMEDMVLPAGNRIVFKPSQRIRDMVNALPVREFAGSPADETEEEAAAG